MHTIFTRLARARAIAAALAVCGGAFLAAVPCQAAPVRIGAPIGVSLFTDDDGAYVIESFHATAAPVKVVKHASAGAARDLDGAGRWPGHDDRRGRSAAQLPRLQGIKECMYA